LPHLCFFFYSSAHPPDLHSFPTRRSSDLVQTTSNPPARPAASSASRVLPMPGSPVIISSAPRPARPAASAESSSARTPARATNGDRKSTRLNSSHDQISYAVFCLKKKKIQ